MINNIEIQNYQSHKESFLEFDKNVNVIIGTSDSGKTAILRALNWCVYNSPNGDSFRSKWGGDTSVSIQVDDHIIKRLKSKKDNSYFIDDNEYKAFGQNVPEEVTKIINFSDLNIQYQLDIPGFLLAQSAGENARYLNKIINLDIVDKSLKNIERQKRENNKNIKFLESELKTQEIEMQKFSDIDDLENKVKITENLIEKERYTRKRYTILFETITDIKEIQNKLEKNIDFEKAENIIINIEKQNKKEQKVKEKISTLISFINSINEYNNKILILNKYIRKENNINNMLLLLEKEKKLRKKEKKYDLFFKTVYIINSDIEKINMNLKEKEKEFKKLFAGKCPICGK